MLNKISRKLILVLSAIALAVNGLYAQTNDDCLMCHEDHGLTKVKGGKTISLFADKNILNKSVHKSVLCASCHKDAAVAEFPHPENLKPVECGGCHKNAQMQFFTGIHGQALKLNAPYAPDCKECHGQHGILRHTNPKSLTYKMNIPVLCGKCHKEGSPVARLYNIPQSNILEHYSESIHGKGLYKSGLIVTATCNDCHGNHLILPHTSPNSSISPNKIAGTCMKCHARIEEVHTKVIKRELWEKQAGSVPACSDCHPSHIVKVKKIEETVSNQLCLKCHENAETHKMVNGQKVSLKINKDDLINSAHKKIACTKCHSEVTVENKTERPCITNKKVDCSGCHEEVSNIYITSGHGQAYFNNKESNAPYCTDCHGTHKVKTRYDDTSPTYRGSIPDLCGKCHNKNGKAVINTKLKEIDAYSDYASSVHGKGLKEKGLLASAVCTDCHTSHNILKESDDNSTVNPKNVPKTCSKCHKSIFDDYMTSDHAITESTGDKKFPTCASCHTAHTITEIDKDKFLNEITLQCGSCHKKLSETYMETYHGKAYTLGYLKAARCSDCHGAHKILKISNPESMIGQKNIVKTCKKCHPNANAEFTGYLTHATHNDNDVLYYTFWIMTTLLLSVFGIFGIHTLLWIPRSIMEARKKKHHKQPKGEAVYFRRFKKSQRITHLFVIVSFLLLALTGMMLKFAHMPWANNLAKLIGGVHVAGSIHRFAAVITFGYFIFHVFSLIRMKIKNKTKLMSFIFGKDSLMFNKQDLKDAIGTVKWFLGAGPRPYYGRWTYWEKFDYMAVFWGVAVIGFSGLILWLPEFFTNFFPGWVINVAQIIHSDEALLAVGFIFTIHFFNTHLRPEAFPMDTVIFTGHVPVEEYKADRPKEYEELEKAGKLDKVIVKKAFSQNWIKTVKVFGFIFVFTGLVLVALIIYSLIAGTY
ncbi:MAG: cytochrome c3 family protein [Bacteroidia bacterium]|nr:cytochrome c3 family protein [Bacteroidia bacterium]